MQFTKGMCRSLIVALLAFAPLTGCTDSTPESCEGAKCDDNGSETPKLCVGMRGNGTYITSHFGAMTRIIEEFGMVDAVAGGSSGSIMSFFMESLYDNTAVLDCGGHQCNERERAERTALMLKSLQGYIEVLGMLDLSRDIEHIKVFAGRIKDHGWLVGLLSGLHDAVQALKAIVEILWSPAVRESINHELIHLVKHSPRPLFHARSVWDMFQGFGSFTADDPVILVRPGLVNFTGFANRLNIVAGFLAADIPVDRVKLTHYLDDCASAAKGKRWLEAKELPARSGTCGEALKEILVDYRENVETGEFRLKRVDGKVGGNVIAPPIKTILATAVLTGDAVGEFKQGHDTYLGGADPKMNFDFNDVQYGYWGHPQDLSTIAKNLDEHHTDNARAERFYPLEGTWRDVLSRSPAEPGLARLMEMDDIVTAGGWGDFEPTLVLQGLGCEKIIYITRNGAESLFSVDVARLLGMTDEQFDALYNVDNPQSGLSQAITEADGVMCTNWHEFPLKAFDDIITDGYNAPLMTQDPDLLKYKFANDRRRVRGCTDMPPPQQ